jgi:hypothetical protein
MTPGDVVPVLCETEMQLLDEYAAATEAYFWAVEKLKEPGANGYMEAREGAEAARNDCTSAREALRLHRQQHGCNRNRWDYSQ